MTPTAPSTSADRASCARPEKSLATARAPRTSFFRTRERGRKVGSEHDVRVEQRDERVEVATAGRRKERLDDLSLAGEIGIGNRR